MTTKNAMHIILRSKIANNGWVLGGNSLIKTKDARGNSKIISAYQRRKDIENIIKKYAEYFDIKVYKLAVAQNHIHLLIKLKYLETYTKFIKTISNKIACLGNHAHLID